MIVEDVNPVRRISIETSDILVKLLKEYKGMLAGGSAYALHHRACLKEHFSSNVNSDLDIYFNNASDYQHAVDYFKNTSTNYEIEKSVTGLCYNVHSIRSSYSENPDVKIQLIGCVFGDAAEILQTFDFKNLEVCYIYDRRSSSYKCIRSKHADNKSNIDVRHSRSPFLMHRIYKYMTYRGFSGITKSSKQHITDWIIKASSGYYNENTDGCPSIYVDLLDNYSFRRMLSNNELITDEDLVYMIGRIKEDINTARVYIDQRGYSRSTLVKEGERDIVIEEMRSRRENEN